MSTEQIGVLSPTIRCSAHATSGNIKQMSSSQTMLVPDFVIFVERLLRNCALSGKSSSVLIDALEIMEMKSIKLIVWYLSKMAYITAAYIMWIFWFLSVMP